MVSLITVTSDSDHSDDDSDDHSDVIPCVAPVSPSVYGTPLTSPRAPGEPSDSEHFTYSANKPWPGTSGQCDQPSHDVSTQSRAHGGEMELPSQNLIQQQQQQQHPSESEVTLSGRSRSEEGERAGGRVRSPTQSSQARPRHNNTQSQQQQQQHNVSEVSSVHGDNAGVNEESGGDPDISSEKICRLSTRDICCDKRATDEIKFNTSSASQQQSISNSSSEKSEKDNHFNLLTTSQQPFKSVTTTTSQSNSSSTSSQHEGREEHFTSLRRLNSLLGILEQESEREMQAPAPAGSQAKVNSFDNLCWIFPRGPWSDFHTI